MSPAAHGDACLAQHIGIIACSSKGAALCYRTPCIEGPSLLGAHAHPPLPTLDTTRELERAAHERACAHP